MMNPSSRSKLGSGLVFERGSHVQLMELHGHYAKLYLLRAIGYKQHQGADQNR